MRKVLLIFMLIYFGIILFTNAQNDIYSRLFYFNQGMFNPAATGLESKNFLTSNFSSWWNKIENHPSRLNFGYERTFDKINSSAAAYYYYSQSGNLTNTNTIGISYSYKFKFSDIHFLKLGVQLNLNRLFINFSLLDHHLGDPCLSSGKESGTKPDINVGIWYSWKKLSIGASIVNVFRPVLIPYSASCSSEYEGVKLPGYLTFTAKYEIRLSSNFNLTPAIYYFSYSNFSLDFDYLDYGINLGYKKIVNFGTIYAPESVSEWTVFAGVKIIKKINIQLSYGFPDKDLWNIGPNIEALVSYAIN